MSMTSSGQCVSSELYAFGHRDPLAMASFCVLVTETGSSVGSMPSATTPKTKQNDSWKLQNFKMIHVFHPPKSVQSRSRGTGHELILSDEHLLWVEGRGFAPASSADGLHSCI